MNRHENQRIIKSEQVDINADYIELFKKLKEQPTAFDKSFIRQIAKKEGFQCSDEKVYKLISIYTQMYLDDVLTSINHRNKKQIEEINKKYNEARNESSKLNRNT